jgi:Bacterial Ig-like domain
VVVGQDNIKVTFDSDLDPGTIADGVVILDSKGKQVSVTTTYSSKTVTLSGIDLKERSSYRLVVLSTVRDVAGNNVAAEYDLDFVGPSEKKHGNHRDSVASPSPTPSPAAQPS